jgi:hypothetical protein
VIQLLEVGVVVVAPYDQETQLRQVADQFMVVAAAATDFHQVLQGHQ